MQAEVGKNRKGIVTGITNFGAFVRLDNGLTGMIHISQVSDAYVADIHQFLSVGQEVEPTVLSVDEKGRIALTLKKGKKTPAASAAQPMVYQTAPQPKNFEEMLSRYKSASEEKISDLRKGQSNGKAAHKRKNR